MCVTWLKEFGIYILSSILLSYRQCGLLWGRLVHVCGFRFKEFTGLERLHFYYTGNPFSEGNSRDVATWGHTAHKVNAKRIHYTYYSLSFESCCTASPITKQCQLFVLSLFWVTQVLVVCQVQFTRIQYYKP